MSVGPTQDPAENPQVVITAVVTLIMVGVILLLGVFLLPQVMQAGGDTVGTGEQRAVTNDSVGLDGSNSPAEIDRTGDVIQISSVFDSLGNAVELSGAPDSFVESERSITLADDDTWSVCTWASVDSGAAAENMTAISANGRVLLQYNGSQGNWSAWYYDDGSTDSWRVNVSAPNQPANYSHVCATHNGTHLEIFRNNTAGDLVNTSAGPNAEPPYVNSTNWDGRLEETRVFDDALDSSERQALVDAPNKPLPGANRTARLMYDEGAGSTTAIFFTGTAADLSNHTWADGFAGEELTAGTDYATQSNLDEIRTLGGGSVDGAPVLWVSYVEEDLSAFPVGLIGLIQSAFVLASVLGVIIVIALVIVSVSGFGRQGGGGGLR